MNINYSRQFLRVYLSENLYYTYILQKMKDTIQEFLHRAPRLMVTKCIDGRMHGSIQKGYPPGLVKFGRTDGNKVNLNPANFWFWNRLDGVVNDAKWNTPGMPAFFISYMHRSKKGYGCAAHANNDKNALEAAAMQTEAVNIYYKPEEVYALTGMFNTDVMSETLIFPDEKRLDSEFLINEFALRKPIHLFTKEFLSNKIHDIHTARLVKHKTPKQLLEPIRWNPFFRDFQTLIAMENFLYQEISTTTRKGKNSLKEIYHSGVINYVWDFLNQQKDFPESLRATVIYQTLWNISYSLYLSNLFLTMNEKQILRHIDHNEKLICYGEGFEIMPRNQSILVKPGRGDDIESLNVAKKVLYTIREHYKQLHPPVLHINVEVVGRVNDWISMNEQIASPIRTLLRYADIVFGDNVKILTTYSYRDQKLFYPIRIYEDARLCLEEDVLDGMKEQASFNSVLLSINEATYCRNGLSRINHKIHFYSMDKNFKKSKLPKSSISWSFEAID